DPSFEEMLQAAQEHYPDKIRSIIAFDADLAQQIYSGSDLFLMPSAFEPCGIAQMNAMRYGTLPLVHETGGLVDTVHPYNAVTGEGTGFSFYDFTPEVLLQTIDLALEVYSQQPQQWRKMMAAAMKQNFSWEASAKEYKKAYQKLTEQ